MLSLTRMALEQFDNQHDFERMAADILNAIGYTEVVPIAPRGGSDDGKDVTFTTESGGKGLACVTLRQDIDVKFKQDFSQRREGEYEKYVFFCTAHLTAKQKRAFTSFCVGTLEAELVPYDVEALRSLLDSSLQIIRDRYLTIQDQKKSEKQIAESIITLLENKRVLYNPSDFEVPGQCTSSILTIRDYLAGKMEDLDRTRQPGRCHQRDVPRLHAASGNGFLSLYWLSHILLSSSRLVLLLPLLFCSSANMIHVYQRQNRQDKHKTDGTRCVPFIIWNA